MRYDHTQVLDASINLRFQQEDAPAQEKRRVFTIRIPILCLIGFSLYLGWIFCLFWSGVWTFRIIPPMTAGFLALWGNGYWMCG